MGDDREEEDSVAKDTQQVEFIKPQHRERERRRFVVVVCLFACCSFFAFEIFHKRLLMKYNKLFLFHFEFVSYLKFPDLCTGISYSSSDCRLLRTNNCTKENSFKNFYKFSDFKEDHLQLVSGFVQNVYLLEIVYGNKAQGN